MCVPHLSSNKSVIFFPVNGNINITSWREAFGLQTFYICIIIFGLFLCTLIILSSSQSSAETCLKKDLSDCVESNQAKQRVCKFCSIHTKYKYRRGVTCKTMEHWLVLLATLNVTGKEELLAKRVQSVVLFTPEQDPNFPQFAAAWSRQCNTNQSPTFFRTLLKMFIFHHCEIFDILNWNTVIFVLQRYFLLSNPTI